METGGNLGIIKDIVGHVIDQQMASCVHHRVGLCAASLPTYNEMNHENP